jgi:hypothetical protein
MAEPILCLTCQHRRVPHVPVPSCVTDTTSTKRFHWREEWRKRTEERRLKEDEFADEGNLFAGEPWFYAWCDYKSREESAARNETVYQLAEAYYDERHVKCPHYATAVPAATGATTIAASAKASEPDNSWSL